MNRPKFTHKFTFLAILLTLLATMAWGQTFDYGAGNHGTRTFNDVSGRRALIEVWASSGGGGGQGGAYSRWFNWGVGSLHLGSGGGGGSGAIASTSFNVTGSVSLSINVGGGGSGGSAYGTNDIYHKWQHGYSGNSGGSTTVTRVGTGTILAMEGGRGGGAGKQNGCTGGSNGSDANNPNVPCRPYHGGDGGRVTVGTGLNGNGGGNGTYNGNDRPTSNGNAAGGASRSLGPISSGRGGNGGEAGGNYNSPWANSGASGSSGQVRVVVTPLYTVTFNSNGGSTVSPSSIVDVRNSTRISSPTNSTKDGHIFNGWWTEESGGSLWNFASNTVTSDITLYARWEAIPAPTGLTATYSDMLSSVELPNGWSWENPSDLVGNAGTQTHKAAFTRADNVVARNIDVTITVNKAEGNGTLAIEDWIYKEEANVPSASSNNDTHPSSPAYRYTGTANSGASYPLTHIPPTEAGNYTVTATFPENDNYKELALTEPFTIHRAEGECYVNMRSYNINDDMPSPEPTTATNNLPSLDGYEYTKIDGLPGTPGKYEIKATFPATDNHNECVATNEFFICGTNNCAPIPRPISGLVFNGTEQTGVPEGRGYSITGNQATEVDEYTAIATLDSDFVWEDGTTIEERQIPWSIAPAPGTFPPLEPLTGTYSPTLILANIELPQDYAWSVSVLNTPLNAGQNQSFPAVYTEPSGNYTLAPGNITVNIAKATGTFPTIEPIEVPYHPTHALLANIIPFLPANYRWENLLTPLGTTGDSDSYAAIYTCPTGNYNDATGEITINFVPANGSGTVSIDSWTYGEPASIPAANSVTNPGTPTFTYTGTANNGTNYSESNPPTEAGTYAITATFPANDLYNAYTTEPYPFTIARANGTGSVSMEDWYVAEGIEPPMPTAESETNGTEGVTYRYRNTAEGEEAWQTTRPSNAGSYIVEATFPETSNYKDFTKQTEFQIIPVTNITVVWSEEAVFTYNKMVQAPIPSAPSLPGVALIRNNAQAAAGTHTVSAEIEDQNLARRYNLTNRTKSYEILHRPLKPYLSTTLPAFEINASKDTLKVPSEVFTDPETLTKILESIISYEGFATDPETNESDNAENSLSGEPTIQLSYEAEAEAEAAVRTRFIASPPLPILSRREPTTQKATAIISTESIASDNYILSNPTITILETIDTETAADLIFCHRGTYCTELSEEVCQFISGTITASCDIARSSCLIDTDRCITNMLTHSCREIGGTPTEACQATPIIPNRENPKIGAIGVQTKYFNLHGTPLGTTKPTTPGVYMERHGNNVKKIMVW